jgi:hypothetical protein
MQHYQKLFNKFVLTGLSIYFTYLPLHAIAGNRSGVIDLTPQEESVCSLDPNNKLIWSKPVKVVGIQGDVANVVLDKDYTDPIDALFGESQKQLFFSIWSNSGILFNGFVETRNQWGARWDLSDGQRYYVVVDGTEYKLGLQETSYKCVYGNETKNWVNRTPVSLLFSNEAKSALLGTGEKSKVMLRWYRQDGNKVYRNEFDIGIKTIESWKLIAQALQAEEAQQNKDCTATVAIAQKNIETGRNIEVAVRSEDTSKNYPDHPANRPYSYVFILKGSASESIMNSPKFMKSIAEKIITNCNSVGAVSFAVSQTGWRYSIGLRSDGKLDFFDCLEHDGVDITLKWGQKDCSL